MFDELHRLLSLGYKRMTGDGEISMPFAPIVQLAGEQWVITEWNIVSTRKWIPYQIDLNRLGEMDWDSHMRGKDWVKIEEFRLAFDTAREMLASGELIAHAIEYRP